MLNLREALEYCGFEYLEDGVLFESECPPVCGLWGETSGPTPQEAFGLYSNWPGWKSDFDVYYRETDGSEVYICIDRVLIVDHTRERMATTCRCEPEGCALAAELVRAWFATGR